MTCETSRILEHTAFQERERQKKCVLYNTDGAQQKEPVFYQILNITVYPNDLPSSAVRNLFL